MGKFPFSSRLVWVLSCCFLLTFLSKCRCFVVVSTRPIRRNDALYRPSYNDIVERLYMSPSLDDAAFFGKNVVQEILYASPIGLPIVGLVTAIILSKSGIRQRDDLRSEAEKVQNNIIKKSEEADIAGKASTVRGGRHYVSVSVSQRLQLHPSSSYRRDTLDLPCNINVIDGFKYTKCCHDSTDKIGKFCN